MRSNAKPRTYGKRPFVFDEGPRYVVTSDFGKGILTLYEGPNRERAVECANFWDERQDTWFEDRVLTRANDALSVANRKFDALIEHIKTGGLG